MGSFLALAACGRGEGKSRILKVGSQKGGTKALISASGALDGADYEVEWSEFPAAQNLLEAIGSGAVDVGLAGDAPFQFAYQSGSPIQAVSAQRANPRPSGSLAIVVPGNSPIREFSQLKGKRVATTRGSIGHYLILRAVAHAGWPVGAVQISFLSPSDAKAAFQSGAIDAWSIWVPYLSSALADGARILVEGRDFSAGYSFDVANVRAVAEKRDILADYLAREAKALEWVSAHVDSYAVALSKETGLPPAIARLMVLKNARQAVPINDQVISDQKIVLDTFLQAGEIKSVRPLDEAFVRKI